MLGHALLALMILTPTDQTVQVARGTRLEINNFAGDVIVNVWDRDAVRVQATHSDRETVDVRQGDQVVTIRSHSRMGPPAAMDYTITVPAWMAVSVEGVYADVTMTGVGGDVSVRTVNGDVTVRGGSGVVSLRSLQGTITLEKAKGRIEVHAVNRGIRLADISGDLSAETTNGGIVLDRIDSSNVDLYTVNGGISYDGPIHDKGLYRLTTHNGTIAMPIAEKTNATLLARSYNGNLRASFPLPDGADADSGRRKRVNLTLGNGSAHVELESFNGAIVLRRPGEPRPAIAPDAGRTRRPAKAKDKDGGGKEGETDLR